MLNLRFERREGAPVSGVLADRALAIAGWTGRDAAAVQAHVEELAALGVPPPPRTPLVYRVASSLLTRAPVIEVQGERTSGEAEFFLFRHEGELWVGIGSDHTCRALETVSVPASKQVCAKPIGETVWRYADLEPHWDALQLQSHAIRGREAMLYQSAPVSLILPPAALLALCAQEGIDLDRSVVFCGTVPLASSWTAAEEFVCQLRDPVLDRVLECRYRIHTLAV
jgi:hypothetical protein